MTPEQKARLAAIEACVKPGDISDTLDDDGTPSIWQDRAWLLALVKELDGENSRQAVLLNGAAGRHVALEMRAERAEQQLAAVTVERDELKREVEQLRERTDLSYDTATLHMRHSKNQFAQAVAWRERAEKAEAERDAFRADLAQLSALLRVTRNDNPFHNSCFCRHCGDARELARLKGEKGGG